MVSVWVAWVAPIVVAADAGFEKPVRLMAAGKPIGVEAPGWACPSWHDLDGDGRKDLIVGQFAGGKMATYRNLGDGKLGEQQWILAGGTVAEVPGIW